MSQRRKFIQEEDKLQEKWYEEAKTMKLNELPAFLDKLLKDYGHDYGTICHAIAAGAMATAHAMNNAPAGGITGFQAGAVMWEFIKHWMHYNHPMKLLDYGDLLYPQMEHKFISIPQRTWEWAQEEAKKYIAEERGGAPHVVEHWKSIAEGNVPFGLRIEKD